MDEVVFEEDELVHLLSSFLILFSLGLEQLFIAVYFQLQSVLVSLHQSQLVLQIGYL